MTSDYAVTVVIPVHQLNRPIARAVESALAAGKPGQVKALVVCHEISGDDVRKRLTELPQEHIELLEFADGIPSPAGPMNAGLKKVATRYVALLGSDDFLEAGALSQWIGQADSSRADAVVARLRTQGGMPIRSPRLRLLRTGALHPVRDRVAYRTAPLGLMRLSTVERLGLQFIGGLRTGEDMEFSLRLWFSGGRIEMGRPGGTYVVGEDAVERVTGQMLPLTEEFRALMGVVTAEWVRELRGPARHAIAVKILRVHVLSAMYRRGGTFPWTADDRAALAAAVDAIKAVAPSVERPLSVAELELLRLAETPQSSLETFSNGLSVWPSGGYRTQILTPRLWDNLRFESNFRYYGAEKFASIRR
ncbi:UDP-Glc:alpha-D-GlcNAc-diphosphoundecaprenol beta-1,3-glucosyltransferase WfgD [Arthrobacter sp. Bi83]|uniref:glycosyltransferase n=1 Tax=Arthrobacter sp. Bi83 TaxID=2822353 RepID=UPI001DB2245C|nr:glycosyltransferase [Arthrobacter sp. Bi83]CAH0143722.1 UDP-Glc:alpha-D-GlcNAc-diphosphoundecaprenol beta-1,3-glucosyltransferase WfgD [Arthrobacter sp. Bi83]